LNPSLAGTVNLLRNTVHTEAGESYDFATIQQGLEDRGMAISRTQRHHPKTADTRARSHEGLLQALARSSERTRDTSCRTNGPLPRQVEQ
jgi:hypothetical protein